MKTYYLSQMTDNKKLHRVLTDIDEVNSQDPRSLEVAGAVYPYELLYGQRMSEMLQEYMPEASQFLQIAARGQHIGRWRIPRSEYPMDRQGYLKWRSKLKIYHADVLAEMMQRRGYSQDEIEDVRSLVIKKGLKSDTVAATLEDVVCFVFLKFYLEEFAAQHEEEKVLDILRKTWSKMTERGQQWALSMKLPAGVAGIVRKALAG